jgi:hypothetical protein
MSLQPLGNRQSWYKDEFMKGCLDKYMPDNKHKRCLNNERDRIDMNLRQPQSMVVSYSSYKSWRVLIPLILNVPLFLHK